MSILIQIPHKLCRFMFSDFMFHVLDEWYTHGLEPQICLPKFQAELALYTWAIFNTNETDSFFIDFPCARILSLCLSNSNHSKVSNFLMDLPLSHLLLLDLRLHKYLLSQ